MLPLQFTPLIKRLRWGGTRLESVLGKPTCGVSDAAESWEVCDRGADQSIVRAGPEAGASLNRLVCERGPELLGRHAGVGQFPLLIKYLDAQDVLSVQVHPNDEQARRLARSSPEQAECWGKTEAWVIIAAEPGSVIFAGLKPGCDAATCARAAATGNWQDCLHRIEVAVGDAFFIPAGTVHAIGAGVLLAEVQQSSDITYRLYDWGRVAADGRPRELHVEQALACIDYERGPIARAVPVPAAGPRSPGEELVRCPWFVMTRYTGSRPFVLHDDSCCRIIMVLAGRAAAHTRHTTHPLGRGETLFIPASAPALEIVPQEDAVVLETHIP